MTDTLADFIVQECIISISSDCALIVCQDEDDWHYLVDHRKYINEAIKTIKKSHGNNVGWATIVTKGETLKTSIPLTTSKPMCISELIVTPTESALIKECLGYQCGCGIVRMADHKGLFSNAQIIESSNAHPNDWIGRNMSDYWIKPELDKYIERLQKEGELRNYSYVAKMMDGRNARLTVNTRLIEWHGQPARIVQTLSKDYLL
jgi:PAS domain-containing protein